MFVNSFNTQILDGRFTLQDVTVDGNVDVSLINNVDMKELNNLVVKKSGDYSLSGKMKSDFNAHLAIFLYGNVFLQQCSN